MNLLKKIFSKSKKRDFINPDILFNGIVLKVYPVTKYQDQKPYLVTVVETNNKYFKTKLVNPEEHRNPHTRTFYYDAPEWIEYHCNRFEIIKNKL